MGALIDTDEGPLLIAGDVVAAGPIDSKAANAHGQCMTVDGTKITVSDDKISIHPLDGSDGAGQQTDLSGDLIDPEPPGSDQNPEDLAGAANGAGIAVDPENLNHPVTEPGRSKVGVLPESVVDDFLDDGLGSDGSSLPVLDRVEDHPSPKYGDFRRISNMGASDLKNRMGSYASEHNLGDSDDVQKLWSQVRSWKGESYSDIGQGLEKRFDAALDLPGYLRNDGLDGHDPTEQEANTAALLTAATQSWFRQHAEEMDSYDPDTGMFT
jgi:hypothetical protein